MKQLYIGHIQIDLVWIVGNCRYMKGYFNNMNTYFLNMGFKRIINKRGYLK